MPRAGTGNASSFTITTGRDQLDVRSISIMAIDNVPPGLSGFCLCNEGRDNLPPIFTQQEIISLLENGLCVDFLLWFLRKNNSPLFVAAIKQVLSSGQEALILQGCRAILCLRPLSDEYIEIVREQLLLLASSKKTDIRTQAVRYLLACALCEPRALINTLSEGKEDTRLLIQAMGWSGLAEYIPSLAAFFDEQRYARLSMLSTVAITGSLPERDGWQMKKRMKYLCPLLLIQQISRKSILNKGLAGRTERHLIAGGRLIKGGLMLKHRIYAGCLQHQKV